MTALVQTLGGWTLGDEVQLVTGSPTMIVDYFVNEASTPLRVDAHANAPVVDATDPEMACLWLKVDGTFYRYNFFAHSLKKIDAAPAAPVDAPPASTAPDGSDVS